VTPLIASLLLLFATAGTPGPSADVVRVDGRGAISLAGYDCVAVARSSVVSRVCHDAANDVAVAEVGARYRAYCDVPRPLVDAWLSAPSMGRFHAERLARGHDCPDGAPR
jgi:hypothetical protein